MYVSRLTDRNRRNFTNIDVAFQETAYAAYLADKDETNLPAQITVNSMQPVKGGKVYLLGHKSPLAWKKADKGFVISIPKSLQSKAPCQHAWVFRFEKQNDDNVTMNKQ